MRNAKNALHFLSVGLLCAVVIYPFLHELGHSLAAVAFGGEVVQISWLPLPAVRCRLHTHDALQYVTVGLSGMVFPALLCLFARSNRFWVWYAIFIIRLICAWSLLLAGLSLLLFRSGRGLPYDDMTAILEKTPAQSGLYGLLIAALLFAVCLAVSRSHPIRRIVAFL